METARGIDFLLGIIFIKILPLQPVAAQAGAIYDDLWLGYNHNLSLVRFLLELDNIQFHN